MIIQGSNEPIVLSFREAENLPASAMSVSLRNERKELKHWSLSDITIEDEGMTYIIPISQQESKEWDEGPCVIEIKWLNAADNTIFLRLRDYIVHWGDKTILA